MVTRSLHISHLMIPCLEQSQCQVVTAGTALESSCLCSCELAVSAWRGESPSACAMLTAEEVLALKLEGQLLKSSVSIDRKPRIPMSTG